MIDIIYLTFNRKEFTLESLKALRANTDWRLVRRIVFYDDGSKDGTRQLIETWRPVLDEAVEIRDTEFGNPVSTMADYLERYAGSDLFFKIDSDAVMPPGWLNACSAVMLEHPELDLLGTEPPQSRKRPSVGMRPHPINADEVSPGPLRYVRCDSIGGIGLMRRSCFDSRPPLNPHGTYGGFTDWQLRNKDLVVGWIAPYIPMFLLDRMYVEPFASLSTRYIASGWQRPWGMYTPEDSAIWEWWTGKR